jgi:hypothetical protein
MLTPFDPIPDLARMLHDEACGRDHGASVRPEDCLVARRAAEDLRTRLTAVGLGIAPLYAVRWIERTFSAIVEERPEDDLPTTPLSPSETRAREQVWIEVRFRDGRRPDRLGPYQRAWAELCLGDLNFGHDAGMSGARIVPEAGWINQLLDEFGSQAA